jgi:hypothetical protein
LSDLIDVIGEEPTRRFTDRLAAEHTNYAAYLKRVWDEHERIVTNRNAPRPKRPELNYANITRWIGSTDRETKLNATRISRYTDNATMHRLATDLIAETDPARQLRYVRLFSRRAFPLDIAPLLALARGADSRLRGYTVMALENVKHPSIRALGLEFFERPDREEHTPRLLINNPGEGDVARFEALLDRTTTDDGLDYRGLHVRKYFETNPTPDALGCLVRLYERHPCSLCRHHSVEMLHEMNAIPDWMRRECVYDSYSETRKLVCEVE